MIDPERGCDEPPVPDEGFVHSVEFERVEPRRRQSLVGEKACQVCGEAVPLYEPHIRAHVWLENIIGQVQRFPVFCSRECWGEWAQN